MVPTAIQPEVAFFAIRSYAALSYLYYERDISLVDDQSYDALCKWLLENWDWIKPHDLNNYLQKDALEAGTGFHLDVTGMTRQWANDLAKSKGAA